MIFTNPIDWIALLFFLASWVGYTLFAIKGAKTKDCLASLLFQYRISWVTNVLRHENRITDIALINGLSQLASFLASTTILVIAGAFTVLSSSERVLQLLTGHEFIVTPTLEQVQFKLLVLTLIFIFAFFRLTWSLRQYTFCSVILGAAPYVPRAEMTTEEKEFALFTAKICDRAAHEFNFGLRSYYFALALLTWFISPWLLFPASAAVVMILYRREFRSRTLKDLITSRGFFDKIDGIIPTHHV